MNKRKWVILAAVGVVVSAMVASYMLATVLPPDALTLSRMEQMRIAGERLRSQGRPCPGTISALAEASPKKPETVDAWGRAISFTCEPGGSMVLSSLGADGKPGGDGMDRDLTIQF